MDPSFDPNISGGAVVCAAFETEGKILIAGNFETVGAVTQRYLARLNGNGSLDSSFAPTLDASVEVVAVQLDGQILLGGSFTMVNSTTRNYCARISATGVLDASFHPNLNAALECLCVQADGKILLGGQFTAVANQPRAYLARVSAAGVPDASFASLASAPVTSLALQTNGKILAGGSFSSGSLVGIARLFTNGTLDPGLGIQLGYLPVVYCILLQADGKAVSGGGYSSNSHLRRSLNETTTQSLQVTAFNQARWLRGGTSPEAERVEFEVSTDGGSTWRDAGDGARITGGWELNGTTLPPQGKLRARARSAGSGNSSALMETTIDFGGLLTPRIGLSGNAQEIVNQDATPSLDDHTNFGAAPVIGGLAARTFTITNVGSALLSLNGTPRVTLSGMDASDFSVTQLPDASLPVGGSTSFQIAFNPLLLGTRTAQVTVASDDFDQGVYQFSIAGTGIGLIREACVLGNGQIIVREDATPVVEDHTDFGPVLYTEGSVTRTFTIANKGTAPLSLTGSPLVTMSGTHATEFTLTAAPSALIAANGSTTFQITFDPSISGLRTATISLTTDEENAPIYNFAIQGSGFAPGELELNFDPGGASSVNCVTTQPDGRLVVGGTFTTFGGVARNRLARLNTNGTLDPGFNPNLNSTVNCASVQADGKILIAGGFSNIGGTTRNRLARLNADGTLDASFNPNVGSSINCMVVQPDGKIVIGGSFNLVGGVNRTSLARLNPSGSLDSGLSLAFNAAVNSAVIQADGKIVLGGAFTTVGGIMRNYVARVTAEGALDPDFNPGASGAVICTVVQPDQSLIFCGSFTTMGGVTRNRIARVNAQGLLDTAFNPNVNSGINSACLQADGRILIGGGFTQVGGVTRNRIARLHANGTLDPSFNPNAGITVFSTNLQPDGKILLGGTFTTIGGTTRNALARLGNEAATQSLLPSPNQVLWLRGGAAPELSQVTFAYSNNDGGSWTSLGNGSRMAGGWELGGLNLSPNILIRARGLSTGGYYNGSSSLVESITTHGPQISVFAPLDTPVLDQTGHVNLDTVNVGSASAPKVFTIKNIGNANLTLGTITNDGTHHTEFQVSALGSPTVSPGDTTTIAVTFSPTARGLRETQLHITSNVPGTENPFDLTLEGTGNAVPTFSGYAFRAAINTPTSVGHAKFLARAADADGDALLLSGVSASSAQGGQVTLGTTGVTYVPSTGFMGIDSFTTTLSDGRGGAVTGLVFVNVNNTQAGTPSGNQISLLAQPDGSIAMFFLGIPTQTYLLQRSTNLQQWSTLATLAADENGIILFIDTEPPAGSAYYRTAIP